MVVLLNKLTVCGCSNMLRRLCTLSICFALALALPAVRAAEITVHVGEFFFNPRNVTIALGDTVKWINDGFQPHDTTSVQGLWASPTLFSGESYSFTFTSSGQFRYVCARHIANFPQQTGLVVVASVNLPPSVSITSPATGRAFLSPAGFSIVAGAEDSDGAVTNVQFFVNGSSVGNSAGPTFSASVAGLVAGNYSLTAVATDNQGATATSQSVNIAVTNPVVTYPLTVSVQPANGGTITGNAPGIYPAGTMLGLTAVASDGFAFAGWSGDASGAENPLTFVMDRPRNIIANFMPVTVPTHTLALLVDPPEGGRIEATPAPNGPDNTYLEGTTISLHALPASAAGSIFTFTNWSGDVIGTNNPLSITITGNMSVTAHFVESLRSVFHLTLATNPIDGGFLQVSPGPEAPNQGYYEGTIVTVTAVAVSTNVFSHWRGDVTSTVAVVSVIMNSDKLLTANFVPFVPVKYSLNVVVTPPNSGTVLATPPLGSNHLYAPGTTVALAAQPNPGFRFVSWSGDVISTNNPIVIVMNGDSTVAAAFTPARVVEFREIAGIYSGLLTDNSTTNFPLLAYAASGSISLRLSKTGAYRGSATIGGMREFVAGQFDRFGYAPLVARRATLSGSLQIDDDGLRMNGLITDGTKSAHLLLYRTVTPKNVALLAGNYSLSLGTAGPVETESVILLRILRDGSVRMHGTLSDGTEFNQRTFLSAAMSIPMFGPLYNHRGVILSWLDVGEDGTVQGTARWFRPGNSRSMNYPSGFEVVIPVTGSRLE